MARRAARARKALRLSPWRPASLSTSASTSSGRVIFTRTARVCCAGEGCQLLGVQQRLAHAPYRQLRVHDRAWQERLLAVFLVSADKEKARSRCRAPEVAVRRIVEATFDAVVSLGGKPALNRAVHFARCNLGPFWNPEHWPSRMPRHCLVQDCLKGREAGRSQLAFKPIIEAVPAVWEAAGRVLRQIFREAAPAFECVAHKCFLRSLIGLLVYQTLCWLA